MTLDDHDRLHPEQRARKLIDEMLRRAGWVVQDYRSINLYAGTGVADRELVTDAGPGYHEVPSRSGSRRHRTH